MTVHVQLDDRGAPPGCLVVGHDVVGGTFAINGGALPCDLGEVCYFGPDTWAGRRSASPVTRVCCGGRWRAARVRGPALARLAAGGRGGACQPGHLLRVPAAVGHRVSRRRMVHIIRDAWRAGSTPRCAKSCRSNSRTVDSTRQALVPHSLPERAMGNGQRARCCDHFSHCAGGVAAVVGPGADMGCMPPVSLLGTLSRIDCARRSMSRVKSCWA